ncbi:hypothetical protein EVU91_07980 [Macrococcoides bohemicum]|uniref:hypothetical protein n=1 Tax=Macrococcoides bohemicum TaxID=1903056 RepID=UPI001059FDA0|nr:hypothetical protein [Macrococcus bohemicus]TDL37025.1 hypothetical protein EVU91_07980 [Macrococcus bohemicus]
MLVKLFKQHGLENEYQFNARITEFTKDKNVLTVTHLEENENEGTPALTVVVYHSTPKTLKQYRPNGLETR